MTDIVETREMKIGPDRVPVMVEKSLAQELASCLCDSGTERYDEMLDRVIRAGLEAVRAG
ncbi:MAG: hypothetical protein R6V85_12950 [Polyangia bacterium]